MTPEDWGTQVQAAERDREFSEYVAARSLALTRTAYLLCGDRHRAEDLVQTALTKLYVAWGRARRADSIDAYVRKILVRASIDDSRRPWRRREFMFAASMPDTGSPPTDESYQSPLLDELRCLPHGQRAAVVLRYWHDVSVEETADLLNCSTSTVKTQSARGLRRLREALAANTESNEAHCE